MEEVDLFLKGGRIIDVLYGKILPPTDVAIDGRKIAGIGGSYKAKKEINIKGKFLAPGFVDSHIHLESSMITPTYFIKTVLPYGTTGIVHDPHEIANIGGLAGIIGIMAETESLPCNVYATIPSCVPATPEEMGLETSGSYIGVKETEILMKDRRVIGLGEMMNIPGVLNREENIMKKIEIAKKNRKIICGHATGLKGDDLKRYFAAGIESDHEVTSYEEAMERLELGIWVEVREGSACHDLEPIISGLVKRGENTDKLLFCNDDINVHDLMYRGHIDHHIRKSIKLGIDPTEAFRIASYNTYRRLKKEKWLGAIKKGYAANLVVISAPGDSPENLDRFKVEKTIYNGQIVFNEDKLLVEFPKRKYDFEILNSVKLAKKYEPKDFTIDLGPKYAGKEVPVRVIEIQSGTIETKERIEKMYTEDGTLNSIPERDILKAFVIGRHDGLRVSKGNVGYGFVKGIGIKQGAIGTSVLHDCHNLGVVGTNNLDMSIAVNRLYEIGGGMNLVENGRLTREIPLRYYGLMSIKDPEEVYKEQEKMNQRLHYLGSELKESLATLSFVSLPVIPELKLTDKGLVKNYKIAPLVVE